MNLKNTVTILFGDIETEGRKQGYAEAGAVYEGILKGLQEDIFSAQKYYENVESSIDKKNEELLAKLVQLEKDRDHLREEVEKRYKIPRSTWTADRCIPAYAIILAGLGTFGYYEHRKKELLEAKARGFKEAKKEYEEKIAKETKNLSLLKKMKRNQVSKKLEQMNDLLNDIVNMESEIAELRILLSQ